MTIIFIILPIQHVRGKLSTLYIYKIYSQELLKRKQNKELLCAALNAIHGKSPKGNNIYISNTKAVPYIYFLSNIMCNNPRYLTNTHSGL